jgi:hypothetical protein
LNLCQPLKKIKIKRRLMSLSQTLPIVSHGKSDLSQLSVENMIIYVFICLGGVADCLLALLQRHKAPLTISEEPWREENQEESDIQLKGRNPLLFAPR